MKCPACFHPLPDLPVALVCQGRCPQQRLTWADPARGYPVRSVPIFEAVDHQRSRCPGCGELSSHEACGQCAYPVPAMSRDQDGRPRPGTFLAMAGARATGKSLMIATMIQQFTLLVKRHFNQVLTPLGSTGTRFEQFYLHPLYTARQVMEPTPELATEAGNPSREPLVFGYRAGAGGDRILAVRDVAGEDLEGLAVRPPVGFGFFARADAVIALLDPLKVREIQYFLHGLVPPPDRLGGDGMTVLANVIRLLEAGPNPSGLPALGVALSKFDVLQQLSEVKEQTWQAVMGRPGAPMRRDPSLSDPGYDPVDGDLLHHEVRGLLQLLRAETVLGMVGDSGLRYRFFATSALGASPTAQSLNPAGIAPFRVLDPLKWAIDGAVAPR